MRKVMTTFIAQREAEMEKDEDHTLLQNRLSDSLDRGLIL